MATSKVGRTLRAVGHGAFVGVTGDTTRLRGMTRQLTESTTKKQRVTSKSLAQKTISSKAASTLTEKYSSK